MFPSRKKFAGGGLAGIGSEQTMHHEPVRRNRAGQVVIRSRSMRPGVKYGVSKSRLFYAGFLGLCIELASLGSTKSPHPPLPVVRGISREGTVTVSTAGQISALHIGERTGQWTLMAVTSAGTRQAFAVFEDFSELAGPLVFAGLEGKIIQFQKSLEPTWAEPGTLYRGHTLDEVFKSDADLLGQEILSLGGDPQFSEVAACFPPIAKMHVYTFIGMPESFEKVGIFYGGGSPNFDPAAYVPAIERIRKETRVLDGLVGGWLPVLRFVYPEQPGTWTELLVYAPARCENGNNRVQPVWYRLSRVESNSLRWARYFDSYHPFPPRNSSPAEGFYTDLLSMRRYWEKALGNGMQVHLPDLRLENMARHCLVREMMTRIGPFPKYGVFDRGYGGSEHDGFPDTFTADTAVMLGWGLSTRARQYIDNYFTYFVRDDGSILYRGPETGQFGRMLTVLAGYVNYTGDDKLLLSHEKRIDAVADLLLSLRAKALKLPASDAAYGLIAGWCEADACLDPDPGRYMQPYFSNSTEAARGLEELGTVLERVGARSRTQLVARGKKLRQESRSLMADVQRAIARSVLSNTSPVCLPAIAGVPEPFDVACRRDGLDPQFRSYRAYMEMLYSGNLTREEVRLVANYRSHHRDIILGIPTAYGFNTHEVAGFLSYGHAYGLLQHDFIREYLLTLYSLMAHQYTRGTWTAPETRRLAPKEYAAPYCAPAEVVLPLLTRWMLVFEDPATQVLWLTKGTPRAWLQAGQIISVSNAPTKWGMVSFQISSHADEERIEATLDLALRSSPASIKLRVRAPEGHGIQSVLVNGKPWGQFDTAEESISLPGGMRGRVKVTVGLAKTAKAQ